MRLLLFLTLLPSTFAIDIVLNTIQRAQNTKNNTAACDNFYRHACPMNSTNLLDHYVDEATALADEIVKSPFAQYEIMMDFAPLTSAEHLEKHKIKMYETNFTMEELANIYYNRCLSGQNNSNFLLYIERLMTTTGDKYRDSCTFYSYCAHHLNYEKNCSRGAEELYNALVATENDVVFKAQKILRANFQSTIGAHLLQTNHRVQNGAQKVLTMLDGMKPILIDWITKTKWVSRASAVDLVTNIVDRLHLEIKFEDIRSEFPNVLKNAEQYYLNCKKDLKSDNLHELTVCKLYAFAKANVFDYDQLHVRTIIKNAYNAHPMIAFGIPFYLSIANAQTEAGAIGLVGIVLAHEISHSVIEDFSKTSHRINFFSKIATDCIQRKFYNTCLEFKEKSCIVDPIQVDENGSDILGSQLAYEYLKKQMGIYLKAPNQPANTTNEQIFFYATSIFFCQGRPSVQPRKAGVIDVHSADNIRVNVFAQLPEFREAFGCSKDSRMVRVNTEQCYIYGPNAPEVKKHRLGNE